VALAIDDEIAKDRTRFLPLDIKLRTAHEDWSEKRSQPASLMPAGRNNNPSMVGASDVRMEFPHGDSALRRGSFELAMF
jgi:hypothetical protein